MKKGNATGIAFILLYVLALFINVLPIVMITPSLLLSILFLAIEFTIPISSVVFWVWGLICAIQGKQDAWAIAYYILFVIMFLPNFAYNVAGMFKKKGINYEDQDLEMH